jgi:hypothetical protein
MNARLNALAEHQAEQHAIDSAWRWFRRSNAPTIRLSEFVARVQARCPSASPEDLRRELERRLARSRSRRRP